MGVRYVPAAALGGAFMAFVPDVLTRYGHGTFLNKYSYDISYDWFQLAVGVLLVIQLIALPDGVWGDLRGRAMRTWSALRARTSRRVSVA
jgi:ABC-type branched-subunit amino acid transport system permease subunit